MKFLSVFPYPLELNAAIPSGWISNDSDVEEGSFPKPSQIVCGNFFTTEKTDAERRRRAGKLPIQGLW